MTADNLFTLIFLLTLGASLLMQWWLAYRQIGHIKQNRAKVPAEFSEHITLDEHQKAADYTTSKVALGRYETAYGALILLWFTLGGLMNQINELWLPFGWSTTITGVVVIISIMIAGSLLDLPFTLYRTFVTEQRFGFNRTTPVVFVVDMLKGALLGILLGGPLIWVILWLMDNSGSLWWLYAWMVWFGFSLFMMWAYPAVIAPLFNKFEALEDGELKDRIESLLQQCGFISKGIYVMDGSRRSAHGNAYFSGIGNNKRIVFYDTLIEQLNADEIEAVLAHELGHFRMHHIRKRLISMAIIGLGSLALLGWLIDQSWFYQGLGVEMTITYMGLTLFMLLSPVFGFFTTPLMSWFSRKHEFEADAYAAKQRDARDLIRALVKMYQENASTLTPDPLYSSFYDSHPPAPVRVSHLQKLQHA